MSKILLVNPLLPMKPTGDPLSDLDTMLSLEKAAIDRFLFNTFVKKEYADLGIKKTFHEHSSVTASLGLLSIAAVLKRAGHDVVYYQMKASSMADPFLDETIMQSDMIGVTAIGTTWHQANEIIKHAKIRKPEIATIIGGPQATSSPVSPLASNPYLDFVCKGDGEGVMEMLAADPASHSNISGIRGLDYRDGSKIVIGKKAKTVDIKTLPTPLYDLVDDPEIQIYIQFSRGCEKYCAFCCEWAKVQCKTPEQISEELKAIEKIKQNNLIFIIDSNFFGNEEKVASVYSAVKNQALTNYFTVQTRIDNVDVEMEQNALERGHIANKFIGIENLSNQVLDKVNKGYHWETVRENLAILKSFQSGIPKYRVNFMQGLPGESTSEAIVNYKRRKQLLDEGLAIFLNDSIFVPTPGSPIFRNPKRYGISCEVKDIPHFRTLIPNYNYNGSINRTNIEIYLHHLDMRRLYNDYIIDKYDLGHIREQSLMVNTEDKKESEIFDLFRC